MGVDCRRVINEQHCWLGEEVFPLWRTRGIDPRTGGFVEELTFEGDPLATPRRAMVQGRQIYSFVMAYRMRIHDLSLTQEIVSRAVNSLITYYRLPSGAFAHSVDVDGKIVDGNPNLYAQAFVLFGLAHAYQILEDPQLIETACKLLDYLEDHNKLSQGGFRELKGGEATYESNPHMHLLEAALAWTEVDDNPRWRKLASEIIDLWHRKFVISSEQPMLAEYFNSQWQPLEKSEGFVFEPGHHYEWVWLLDRYRAITGDSSFGTLTSGLFQTAENLGIHPDTRLVLDEIWSSKVAKSSTSRFWPQCERIKASLVLGLRESGKESQLIYSVKADEALEGLLRFFKCPGQGLWQDRIMDNGQFSVQSPKASSLYHIICALNEYEQKRTSLD